MQLFGLSQPVFITGYAVFHFLFPAFDLPLHSGLNGQENWHDRAIAQPNNSAINASTSQKILTFHISPPLMAQSRSPLITSSPARNLLEPEHAFL
jgi:hypothetical protein